MRTRETSGVCYPDPGPGSSRSCELPCRCLRPQNFSYTATAAVPKREPAAGCTWVLAVRAGKGWALDNPAGYATPIPVLSAPASCPAGACGPEILATQRPQRCPSASPLYLGAGSTCVSEIVLQLNYMATTISLSFLLRIMLIRL